LTSPATHQLLRASAASALKLAFPTSSVTTLQVFNMRVGHVRIPTGNRLRVRNSVLTVRNKESTETFFPASLFPARQIGNQKDPTPLFPSNNCEEYFCWLSFVLAFYSMNEPADMLVAPSQLSRLVTPSLAATRRRPTRTAAMTAVVAAAPPPTKS
jgi:hypothetical protein